jgi:ATP-dependent RNA helicase RhlE
LASWLERQSIAAEAIHSDRTQAERTRALEAFKRGEVIALVATDVAARGLDIEDLPHVVNFELPFDPQDYIHRIGRTGRAGLTGDAISLVCMDEADLLRGVQRLLKRAIPWRVEEGFVPERDVEPRPLRGPGSASGRSESGARGGSRSSSTSRPTVAPRSRSRAR